MGYVDKKCEGMVVCDSHPIVELHSGKGSHSEKKRKKGGTAEGEIQGPNHQTKSAKRKKMTFQVFF